MKATCHPDRNAKHRGLCSSCYVMEIQRENPRPAVCHPDRPHYGKDLCKQCYASKYDKEHVQERRKWDRAFYQRHRASRRRYRLRIRGIGDLDYDALSAAQGGVCAICHRRDPDRELAADHDHQTGLARGLLCRDCNVALGLLGDDPERLEKAAAYIRMYRLSSMKGGEAHE